MSANVQCLRSQVGCVSVVCASEFGCVAGVVSAMCCICFAFCVPRQGVLFVVCLTVCCVFVLRL